MWLVMLSLGFLLFTMSRKYLNLLFLHNGLINVILDNEDLGKDVVVKHQNVLPFVWRCGTQRKFDSLINANEVNVKVRQIIKHS